jgi:UDP-N-acetylmuramate--alanine ligase
MKVQELHSVHFLGIGGIGMSALARWFRHLGKHVSGYDRTPSALTVALEAEGMLISYNDDLEGIPERVKQSTQGVLVVWTPAMPSDSIQLKFFESQAYDLKKRAAVLGWITSAMPTVAVAGTHGKTTTSSMVAHLLKSGGKNIAAFLGGITQNYQNNLILQENSDEEAIMVVEADEFDRSFLHLHPNLAVVTSVDPDHLDIYGDGASMIEGFGKFINLISPAGMLFIQEKAYLKLENWFQPNIKIIRYGLDSGEVKAENVVAGPAMFSFSYSSANLRIDNLELHMPGFHNVENALAAIAIALELGLDPESIRRGLNSYKGVKRRFEIHVQQPDRVYIDDYAHHPEEIKAFLTSVKAMYPTWKLTAVFQPHLFTRTRDFAVGFSESLSLADQVLLLEIYPARELPIEGIESGMLLEGITSEEKQLLDKVELLKFLEEQPPQLLVTIGAGDIDRLVEPIKNLMLAYAN